MKKYKTFFKISQEMFDDTNLLQSLIKARIHKVKGFKRFKYEFKEMQINYQGDDFLKNKLTVLLTFNYTK